MSAPVFCGSGVVMVFARPVRSGPYTFDLSVRQSFFVSPMNKVFLWGFGKNQYLFHTTICGGWFQVLPL